ncbi:MAG: hypothetical protein ACXAC6_00095 [Candidatus Hodarchaeales archaeon]|jgi:hypothetical protein
MREKPRDITIETLTTPKGDIPTVKGLETVMNSTLSSFHEDIKILEAKIEKVASTIEGQSELISNLGRSMSELIVSLGKLDRRIELNRSTEANTRIVGAIDLLSLKEEISSILTKIENILPDTTE